MCRLSLFQKFMIVLVDKVAKGILFYGHICDQVVKRK